MRGVGAVSLVVGVWSNVLHLVLFSSETKTTSWGGLRIREYSSAPVTTALASSGSALVQEEGDGEVGGSKRKGEEEQEEEEDGTAAARVIR
ncbi:unnamed protein product [Mesocestoides corti]|uniref:Secreted protein n=1 Tax=Mesocestoides corti TaxID=53468 RepID=A0A0R3UR39_MESCO|nr:unnamed protein product [Mesocestoides corti]